MNLGMSLKIHCEDSAILGKATKFIEETLEQVIFGGCVKFRMKT